MTGLSALHLFGNFKWTGPADPAIRCATLLRHAPQDVRRALRMAAGVVGDDYVQVTQSDPSVLVNVASFAGLVGSSPMLALVPLVFFGVREEMQTAAIPMEYALEPIPDETPADQDD